MSKVLKYLVNIVNRLFWKFYYCIILFLILKSYNYDIINWVYIINWVNNINNYFMIALLALIYLWYINSENINLIFINDNSLLINELNDKEKDILLMRIAETLLKKGVKRNNLNNSYTGRRNYGTSRICFGRNDNFSTKTQGDIEKNISEGLFVQNLYNNLNEIVIKKEILIKNYKDMIEHPIFNEQSGKVETEFLYDENGNYIGEEEYIWMELVNISDSPQPISIDGHLIFKTFLGIDKKGRNQYLVNAIYKYKISLEDFRKQKAFKRDKRIGEDQNLTNRIVDEVNKNGQNYYNINLWKGTITVGNNNTQWDYYETVNDFYGNIK